MTTKRKWLRTVLTVAVVLAAANLAISGALQMRSARRYLLARLGASFGRPVEVARFGFSILDGARLEAHSVTVAEDPHFGNEYFLRAETLTAGLRWSALFSGRFEFGSLSLVRPSLNLVRDVDGHWNIERWLPPAQTDASRPGFVGPLAAPRELTAARLYRISVDAGRINFKQRDEKIPFAFTDVSGRVDQDSTGRWQLDLEALPMRAGVELQDIGTLRVRGTIAGTSARLQPADLNLTWRAASLADTLRLARQNDYGMRGELSVDLNARLAPPDPNSAENANSGGAMWSISVGARLTGIHGWRLAGHDIDPKANLSLEAEWRLGEPRAQIRNFVVEMPNSRLRGTGEVDWGNGLHPQLHIEPSTLGLADVLSWYRSLRPEVAADVRAEGSLGVDLTLGGWPLQLQQGTIASAGATVTANSLPALLQIGPINARVSHGGLDIAPTEFSFSTASSPRKAAEPISIESEPPSAFLLRGSIFPETGEPFHWPLNWILSVDGETPRVQDWLLISQKLAQPLNVGWTASGGLAIKMRGDHRTQTTATQWIGTMDSRKLTVSPAFVNQPVELPKAHLEYTMAQQTITLPSVEAFAANWHGTITRKTSVKQWTFDLSVDHLDTVELDRWLGPRARPGFLERITSFGSDAAAGSQTDAQSVPPPEAGIAQIEARGHLRADEIVMTPMRLEKFDGDVELSGRAIKIYKGLANFFGGQATGTLNAHLLADPSYEFNGHFDRVNMAQLARAVPSLKDRIAGIASAELSLTARGIGRKDLIHSLEGSGTLNARNLEIRGFNLTGLLSGEGVGENTVASNDPSSVLFETVKGPFQIHGGGIVLTNFVMERPQGPLLADGRIDFSHTLDIHIRPMNFRAATSMYSLSPVESSSVPPSSFLLNGTIEDPKLVPPSSASNAAAKSSARGR